VRMPMCAEHTALACMTHLFALMRRQVVEERLQAAPEKIFRYLIHLQVKLQTGGPMLSFIHVRNWCAGRPASHGRHRGAGLTE